MPDSAARPRAYRHVSAEGRSVLETEPTGKAAEEIRQIYEWACRQVGLSFTKRKGKATR